MAIGFIRCAECDREITRADAILHRTPTGSRFFCETCVKEKRKAEARDAAAPGEVANEHPEADDPESAE